MVLCYAKSNYKVVIVSPPYHFFSLPGYMLAIEYQQSLTGNEPKSNDSHIT